MNLELVSRPHFSYIFVIKSFPLLYYRNWPNFITRLCLLHKLFSKMCLVFHALRFNFTMIFKYLKSKNLIISRTKRAFEVKQNTFFLASQLRPCSLTKQTSKNLPHITFNSQKCFLLLEFPKFTENL